MSEKKASKTTVDRRTRQALAKPIEVTLNDKVEPDETLRRYYSKH